MSAIKLTIDGREVEVAEGQSVLDAARKLGIDVPTLCYLEKCGPLTTCQVCLVKVVANGQSRFVPSCGTKATPGMVVESEADDVHDMRRTALELLFSDHVGDCLSPCNRLCPLQLNIPVMIRQIEAERFDEAIVTIRQSLPLPTVLGRLCHHPCEQGCRRGAHDDPAAIREMERFVADLDIKLAEPHLVPRKPATGKSVAIVGAGPAGLAAADYLAHEGHACTVFDRHDKAGGSLRTGVDEQSLPREVLDAEIAVLEKMGIQFKLGVELGAQVSVENLQRDFDAVLMTVGQLDKASAEKLGLAATASGIKADANTCQASLTKIFAAGSAVKPVKQLVKAMSEGKAAAECVNQFLSSRKVQRPDKPFSSIMGKLDACEVKKFVATASPEPRVSPCDTCVAISRHQATGEASRCLHCDCRSSGNCTLQHYAQTYEADASRFRGERRPFEQYEQPGGVIFEPGKCILCGICVKLTEMAREPLGLTFIGRGFDVRVATPFNRTIEEGLQKVAKECVEGCPTGAIVFREEHKHHAP